MLKVIAIAAVIGVLLFIGMATLDSCKRNHRCGYGTSQQP